jgi:hypothetical protein
MAPDCGSDVALGPTARRLTAATAEAFPPRLAGRVRARLVARLRPRHLNRELIAGADPSTCAWLAARARRLTSASYRVVLASGLRLLLDAPDAPPGRVRVRPPACAVRENATQLRAVSDVLSGPAPVYARGMAMLDEMLADGTGPVYVDRSGRALAQALTAARAALAGG